MKGRGTGWITVWLLGSLLFAGHVTKAAGIEVLWLGHATTRITSVTGKVIVIDPFLTRNPKTPPEFRDLKALGKVDLILVTHGHGDHTLDLKALADMTGATVVGGFEFVHNLNQLGILPLRKSIGINKGGTVSPLGRGIKVHMVPAEHSSSLHLPYFGLKPPEGLNLKYVIGGPAAGYVIELENGFTIYHSGDTGVFGDMALIHEFYRPDLAMVCIGGHFTMDPQGAAYAVRKLLKPKMVIPIHYGTYPVINRTPAEFEKALGDTPVKLIVAVPGKPLRF